MQRASLCQCTFAINDLSALAAYAPNRASSTFNFCGVEALCALGSSAHDSADPVGAVHSM